MAYHFIEDSWGSLTAVGETGTGQGSEGGIACGQVVSVLCDMMSQLVLLLPFFLLSSQFCIHNIQAWILASCQARHKRWVNECLGLALWYAEEQRNLFLHFIWTVFLGVRIPFMYTQGFTDLAMTLTLTRTGSGVTRYSTRMYPFSESVYGRTEPRVRAHRLSTGFSFVSQPTIQQLSGCLAFYVSVSSSVEWS